MKKHVFAIVVSSFVAILLISFIGKKILAGDYKMSVKQKASLITSSETIFSLYDLYMAIQTNDPKLLLIDIRSESDYALGHLPNAINVPIDQLFNKENKEYINTDASIQRILYGKDESQAVKALAILVGRGYSNFKILSGGYEIARKYVVENPKPSYFHYSDEKKKYDYPKLMPAGTSTSSSNQQKKDDVVASAPRGGC